MKKRSKLWLTVVPLYVFTLLFVLGPMIYMVVLSFQTRAEVWGVVNHFTLDNYKNIFHPVYLQTFAESFKLAIISTLFIVAIGYPFGYFMAKLGPKWKRRTMLLLMIPFWTSSLIRLYGWIIIFRAGGVFDSILMALHITSEPLKLLYTYPAVVVGMVGLINYPREHDPTRVQLGFHTLHLTFRPGRCTPPGSGSNFSGRPIRPDARTHARHTGLPRSPPQPHPDG